MTVGGLTRVDAGVHEGIQHHRGSWVSCSHVVGIQLTIHLVRLYEFKILGFSIQVLNSKVTNNEVGTEYSTILFWSSFW